MYILSSLYIYAAAWLLPQAVDGRSLGTEAGSEVYVQWQQMGLAWLFLQARASVLLQVKIVSNGHKVECHLAKSLAAGFHVSHVCSMSYVCWSSNVTSVTNRQGWSVSMYAMTVLALLQASAYAVC